MFILCPADLFQSSISQLPIMSSELPPPAENQAYITVSAMEAGMIYTDTGLFIDTVAVNTTFEWVPALTFLLKHSTKNTNFLFDLGIWKDHPKSPPKLLSSLPSSFKVEIPQDAIEALAKGGLTPLDIDTVCISHVHFDHTGYSVPFTKSEFILGGDAAMLFEESGFWPEEPDSPFRSGLVPLERTKFLGDNVKWEPIGPFPRAHDFYGDGSLYIIDAPGHLPGHINVLARTSADGGWIYLAGDAAHHWNLITGEAGIACNHQTGKAYFHQNPELSRETIRRMREVLKNPRVRVVLAHDLPWYKENKGGDAFFPGSIKSL
ncbi:N-acyl homoserine lactonase AttM [Leucoagaricus sp. SymC.cos]|nr:N-acyl homoserine lactonase AttM [Leucoagaricus sp. SymC.cos]